MAMSTDKIRVSTYVEPELKRQAERLARIQKRSFSNLLEVMLEQSIAEAIEKGLIVND